MSTKAAKSEFTRSEVIEILRKNVELYSHEPGFIDYLLNLTLYLTEHSNGEKAIRSLGLAEFLTESSWSRKSNSAEKLPVFQDHTLKSRQDDVSDRIPSDSLTNLIEQENESIDESSYDPPVSSAVVDKVDVPLKGFDKLLEIQNQKRKNLEDSQFEPLMKAPPSSKQEEPVSDAVSDPVSDLDYHEPKTDKLNQVELEEIQRQTKDESLMLKMESIPLLDVPVKRQRNAPRKASVTPPEAAESTGRVPEKAPGDPPTGQLGRAQVYKVVRTYKQKKDAPDRCPACNAYTRGRSVCPSCGHIL